MNALTWHPSSDGEAVAEIVRLGEIKLEDMLATALASDSRAINQASIFAALAAGLFAAAIAVAQMTGHAAHLVAAPAIAAVIVLVASFIARQAASPVDFYGRGYTPAKLSPYADNLDQLRRSVAFDLDCRIRDNAAHMAKSAKLLGISFQVAVGGLLFGGALALIGP